VLVSRDAYRDAGVDIEAADALVDRIKPLAAATSRPEVLGGLGGFGGLFRMPEGLDEPVLVSGTDGVGTKLLVAQALDRHETIGIDLVAMCVNDIVVTGAEPLFFLDYFATGALDEEVLPAVLAGFAAACRENGCALLGGETAEMPGVYAPGEFDLAGTIVGRVEPEHVLDGQAIRAGDRAWGLPSTGLHTNGYSLARKVLLADAGLALDDEPDGLGTTVGEALLAVHRSYLPHVRTIWAAAGRGAIHGLAHITGGGFYDNVPRVVPEGLGVVIDTTAWATPPIFELIASCGDVEPAEMHRVFNMGIGMVVIAPPAIDLHALDVGGLEIGEVIAADRPVDLRL
jgi:phosphoribosylformylglycinamidine cyclo-ligase